MTQISEIELIDLLNDLEESIMCETPLNDCLLEAEWTMHFPCGCVFFLCDFHKQINDIRNEPQEKNCVKCAGFFFGKDVIFNKI